MPIARAFDRFDDMCRWHVRCSFTGRAETPKERNAMKLPAMLAGTTAGLLLLAGLAVAQGPVTPPPQPSMTQPATDMSARHTMTGQVTSVTPDKGRILVKTPEGRMLLHFPSSALQNVKKGDSVTVELALTDNGPAPKAK
jgi:hypothetical protein